MRNLHAKPSSGDALVRATLFDAQRFVGIVPLAIDAVDFLLSGNRFRAGADDQVRDLFSPRGVIARVRAKVHGAANAVAPAPATSSTLDEDGFKARRHGRALVLTPSECRPPQKQRGLPDRVFSHAQWIEALHEDQRMVSDRTVDCQIKNLRRTLSDLGENPILALYGVGYRFETPDAVQVAVPG